MKNKKYPRFFKRKDCNNFYVVKEKDGDVFYREMKCSFVHEEHFVYWIKNGVYEEIPQSEVVLML